MSINTGGILSLTSQWSEIETDPLSVNNVTSDVGNISYNFTYSSGTGPGKINEQFHIIENLQGMNSNVYDLQNMTGSAFGKQIVTTFSRVKSITIKHLSGDPINLDFNNTNSFDEPFGSPSSDVVLQPSGYRHINTTGDGWVVDSSNKIMEFGNPAISNDVLYEILILGEK